MRMIILNYVAMHVSFWILNLGTLFAGITKDYALCIRTRVSYIECGYGKTPKGFYEYERFNIVGLENIYLSKYILTIPE